MADTFTKRDALNRAQRVFLQGIGFDVLAAVVLYLFPIFQNAQKWSDFDWRVMIFFVVKTVVVTIFAYLMRTVLDRSKIPTPLPPVNPGVPVNPAA